MEQRRFDSKLHQGEYLDYWYHCDSEGILVPLIVYIHGAGGRGTKLTQMETSSALLGEIEKGRKLNAVVIAPQCHADTWFELFEVLIEFIDEMRRNSDIDSSRVYLTGSSMGAYTSWQLAMSKPEWFAALVPVCGGGMYWNAERLKKLPIWAFHGVQDKIVLPEESIHMVDAVNRVGGNAKITLYPDVPHHAWVKAFADDELYRWMFAQRRGKIRDVRTYD